MVMVVILYIDESFQLWSKGERKNIKNIKLKFNLYTFFLKFFSW